MKKNNKLILGVTSIDSYAHDNSIAILKNGKILFAAAEERYSRIKHDGAFPKGALKGGLGYLRKKISDIELVAVGYPKRSIISLFKNKHFYEFIPFTANILIRRNIGILGDLVKIINLFYSKTVAERAQYVLRNKLPVYVDHHLAHSASAYYTSGYGKCLSIVMDAFGSQADGTIRAGAVYCCEDGQMREVMSIPIYGSLGLFYQSITYALGFNPGDGEGKTMGLAAYGDSKKVYKLLRPFIPKFENGKLMANKDWLAGFLPCIPSLAYLFHYTEFGSFLRRVINKYGKENVAASAQLLFEEQLEALVKFLLKKYPEFNSICLSGGIFLNVKANKRIMELPGVEKLFVHPNSGDGGVSLGAAFATTDISDLRLVFKRPQFINSNLGESFNDSQILKVLKSYGDQIIFEKKKDIAQYTANQLISGKVIGWFQGRAEWGARALGFRSVLADPRKIKVKERINKVLKNRDWFMPFAPSILEESGENYFKNFRSSPFMTFVFDVVPKKAKLFPAAMHIDSTARPNTVTKMNNFIYYQLINNFEKKTGLPILLNTSFNRHGLPIVNSPKDAVDHLIMGAVDELIIGNYSVNLK